MIHSLSGGVIADGSVYTFAKVQLSAGPRWFIAPFPVAAGDRVLAPFGDGLEEGTVLRTEDCTRQTAPIPLKSAKFLERPAGNR